MNGYGLIRHEYKGYKITKRSGTTFRRGHRLTGYFVFVDYDKKVFSTLKDAKLYIDALGAK